MDTLWPDAELEHIGRCPVCGEAERDLVYASLTDKLFHCSADRWRLHACRSCGTHYLDPRPSATSIHRAYTEYLTHDARPASHSRAAETSLTSDARDFARALANGYRNGRWGTQFEPSHSLGRLVVPCIPPLREAIVQQMRGLPKGTDGRSRRLLDVGCGSGSFLELARMAGWAVEGIDFDGLAVATARRLGLDVRQGGIELLDAMQPASYEWITLSHVLEHVHEPVRWLEALNRILSRNGALWLQTPNIESIGHVRYRDDWRGLEPPRHLSIWTLATLTRKLREVGFGKIVAIKTPLLTAMELYASSEAIGQGLDYAEFMARPAARRKWLRHLLPALRQHWNLRHGEFHTVVAVK